MFRAADDRALGRDHHGTLHQPRMFHQQVDDGTRRLVVGLVQSELGKDRILPDEICHRAIKLPDDLRQCLARGLGLEVLDGVELDTTLLKNLQRARRRVSMRVVEDRDGGHKPIMAEPRPWGRSAEHSWVGSCSPRSIQPTQTRWADRDCVERLPRPGNVGRDGLHTARIGDASNRRKVIAVRDDQ